MQKKIGSGVGAFILVAAFVWIVFDNLALGLIFGLMAALATSGADHRQWLTLSDRLRPFADIAQASV